MAVLRHVRGHRTRAVGAPPPSGDRKCDITTRGSWHRIVDHANSLYGCIDILVNNAGLSSTITDDPFDDAVLRTMLDINLQAPLLGIQATVPSMIERAGGSIVNISSVVALAALDPGHGIRANNVFPGAMPSMRQHVDPSPEDSRRAVEEMTALKRIGTPDDIAYAVPYLASDESASPARTWSWTAAYSSADQHQHATGRG